ncbi:MAG TPA: enoyl-CoA hydratase/isomerase family protein [Propionibacteriaceae bacterium]|nr:enoyl-CoA hydratase/isomerase family protein [Propionibacteriaceae bacterium]
MDRREVRFEVHEGVGYVELGRPRTINALTADMLLQIDLVLSAWATDPAVDEVQLTGVGERGFCSGADVRLLRAMVLTDPDRAVRFFEREYAVNALIAEYPKPVTALMRGITMGGGLGLAQHATQRVATPDLRWAMPETTIGFFPDVGVLYELSRLPGEVGTYLALTGVSIDAASAKWAGLVDRIDAPAPRFPSHCALSAARWWIDECFVGDDPGLIVHRLETHWFDRARAAGALLRTKSPLAVSLSLEAIRRARRLHSVREVLAQDLALARNLLWETDFVEGVRAQVVDKDRSPRWWHARVEDVPRDLVLGKFAGAPVVAPDKHLSAVVLPDAVDDVIDDDWRMIAHPLLAG